MTKLEILAYKYISRKNKGNDNYYHNFFHLYSVYKAVSDIMYVLKLDHTDPIKIDYEQELKLAALFHDFNHSGKLGPDSVNIEEAIKGLENFLDFHKDRDDVKKLDKNLMIDIIKITEFPYRTTENLPLYAKIIRDADMYSLLQDWSIVTNFYGLRKEWNQDLLEFLTSQTKFIEGLKWNCEHLQQLWDTSSKNKCLSLVKEILLNVE